MKLGTSYYDVEQAERLRICSEAKRYLNTSPSEWSFTVPKWDLTRAGQRYVTQDRTETALRKHYPDGLTLALVDFEELDAKLVSIFRCSPNELWTAHFKDNIAEIILHWSEGMALTPPMIRVFKDLGAQEVTINDGSHRLAVARALGVRKLHILMDKNKFPELRIMLPSLEPSLFRMIRALSSPFRTIFLTVGHIGTFGCILCHATISGDSSWSYLFGRLQVRVQLIR